MARFLPPSRFALMPTLRLHAMLSTVILLISAEAMPATPACTATEATTSAPICLDGEPVDCERPMGRIEQLACTGQIRADLERELEAHYERLLRSFDQPGGEGVDHAAAKIALVASQEGWRRYVEADCVLDTALFGLGNGHAAAQLDCRMDHLRARILRLRALSEDAP
jgi:uncharacterized protein YecT (DUF1311 family)